MNRLRGIVFDKGKATRRLHVDETAGASIDMSYILPNVIAMSFPASGLETVFRNDLNDVAEVLRQRHASSYLIYNVSERRYDYAKFDHQVMELGWPDHHAPPFKRFCEIMLSMESWLNADSANVVVVHCMAGKGRTGTVIAAYLLYSCVCATTESALFYFARARSKISKGVTRPSQMRYVKYLERYLLAPKPLPVRRVRLRRLSMSHVPHFDTYQSAEKGVGGCCPYVEVLVYELPALHKAAPARRPAASSSSSSSSAAATGAAAGDGHRSPVFQLQTGAVGKKCGAAFIPYYCTMPRTAKLPSHIYTLAEGNMGTIDMDMNCILEGDALIRVWHVKENMLFGTSQTEMFHCCIHTMFIDRNTNKVVIKKPMLEEAYKSSKFPADFQVTLYFDSLDDDLCEADFVEDPVLAQVRSQFSSRRDVHERVKAEEKAHLEELAQFGDLVGVPKAAGAGGDADHEDHDRAAVVQEEAAAAAAEVAAAAAAANEELGGGDECSPPPSSSSNGDGGGAPSSNAAPRSDDFDEGARSVSGRRLSADDLLSGSDGGGSGGVGGGGGHLTGTEGSLSAFTPELRDGAYVGFMHKISSGRMGASVNKWYRRLFELRGSTLQWREDFGKEVKSVVNVRNAHLDILPDKHKGRRYCFRLVLDDTSGNDAGADLELSAYSDIARSSWVSVLTRAAAGLGNESEEVLSRALSSDGRNPSQRGRSGAALKAKLAGKMKRRGAGMSADDSVLVLSSPVATPETSARISERLDGTSSAASSAANSQRQSGEESVPPALPKKNSTVLLAAKSWQPASPKQSSTLADWADSGRDDEGEDNDHDGGGGGGGDGDGDNEGAKSSLLVKQSSVRKEEPAAAVDVDDGGEAPPLAEKKITLDNLLAEDE